MVHHPTSRCYVLKDKIQSLVNAGVLTLKSEQKKVTTNMVTLNFGTFPKMTVQDRLVPIFKAILEVINPMVEQQKTKGLIQITTESGEIMWVHPDIVQISNERLAIPSSKASHAMSSLSQQMTTL